MTAIVVQFESERLRAALRNMAQTLGIAEERIARSEDISGCAFDASCTGAEFVRRLTRDVVQGWFAAFEADLRVSLEIPEYETRESLTHDHLEGLDRVAAVAIENEVPEVAIHIAIKKVWLKEQLRAATQLDLHGLFFYQHTLARQLTLEGVEHLRAAGALSPDRHSTIAIVESDGLAQTPYYTLVGLRGAALADVVTVPDTRARRDTWAAAQTHRAATASWAAPLGDMDPATFLVEHVRGELAALCPEMWGLCAVLSLFQMCVSVRQEPASGGTGGIWRASVAYPGSGALTVPGDRPIHASAESANAFWRLYSWTYAEQEYDKLDIARDLLRNIVRLHSADVLEEVLRSGVSLLNEARANYTMLRRKAYEEYVRTRDAAREALQTFVKATHASVAGLAKDVSDISVRFAGGIIAFLAASVLNKDALHPIVYIASYALSMAYLLVDAYFQIAPVRPRYEEERGQALRAIDSMKDLSDQDHAALLKELPAEYEPIFQRHRHPWIRLRGGPAVKRWVVRSLVAYWIWGVLLTVVFAGLLYVRR